jgi:hypothetical protein
MKKDSQCLSFDSNREPFYKVKSITVLLLCSYRGFSHTQNIWLVRSTKAVRVVLDIERSLSELDTVNY